MIKRLLKILIYIIAFLIILDFIPVKFAVKDVKSEYVFVNLPKLSHGVSWARCKLNDKSASELKNGYIINGKSPDKILSGSDFDKVNQFLDKDKYINKFLIEFDNKKNIVNDDFFPVYKIEAKSWNIVYPIKRTSLRKYYVSKGYLTIYDFDWVKSMHYLLK